LDTYWTDQNQSAECLYLILSQIVDQDTKAMDYFSPQEIGDIDNDGMPEILDGWGRPIIFLRWAPGLQIVGSPQDGKSPDPYDLLGVYKDSGTFALYPLVASSGPDGQLEVVTQNLSGPPISYAFTVPPNNPFLGLSPTSNQGITSIVGAWVDVNNDGLNGTLDNITNHNLSGS
jgi:hypothetical protein